MGATEERNITHAYCVDCLQTREVVQQSEIKSLSAQVTATFLDLTCGHTATTEHPTHHIGHHPVVPVALLTITSCDQAHIWEVAHKHGSPVVKVRSIPPFNADALTRIRWPLIAHTASYVETRDEADQWVEVFEWMCGGHLCQWERATLKPDDGVLCVICRGVGTVRRKDSRSLTWDTPCWCCSEESGVLRGRHRTLSEGRCKQ